MPGYAGKFQYTDQGGAVLNQGPCQFRFDAETGIVTPAAGTPIAFDLGDVDRAVSGEWDFSLTLFTGRRLELRQFGAAFGRMSQELLAAWRDRTVRCLLLEDLEELGRFSGTAALTGSPELAGPARLTGTAGLTEPAGLAEIRLYRSNLAVLPLDGPPVQWRLAEVDAVQFDEASYSVALQSGGERLVVARLAQKTDEFRGKLGDALDALRTHQAEALHATFPFLDPDQLQRVLEAMPEGRSVAVASLQAIHPMLPEALIARTVDARLRPYFDALRARAVGEAWMTGFKFIRPDEEAGADEDKGAEDGAEQASTREPDAPAPATPGPAESPAAQPLFFWFFFPLANGRVAWEATTGSGRATYFFEATAPFFDARAPVEQSIARLTRGLALVNFRREPVYLPDDSLERQPRFRRYAIGARKLPELRLLRAAFRGRAIHISLEAWTAQVDHPQSSFTG
jgi:hypothetical protein